jgi:fido (protein-threonine AMPylation protein)
MARSRQNASAGWPEVVHTRSTPRRTINREVAAGRLRPLGPRLYTTNLADDDATIIRRNIWRVIALLAPSGIISARTGLTLRPTAEGTVFLVGPTKYDRDLPGLRIRVAKGSPAQEGDFPYLDGLLIASRPRALLEALQYPARPRGRTARTLTNAELEQELEKILQTGGEFALNRLRDEARALAPALHAGDAYERLSQRIAVVLGSRPGETYTPTARARLDGAPYDADRIALFESLFARLRSHEAPDRPVADESPAAFANVSFFDAYFSNFIEGTEFEIDEARAIVFDGYIPNARPEDAKDVLGTFGIVGNPVQMRTSIQALATFEAFRTRLAAVHVAIMAQRIDRRPGHFKEVPNRAGDTRFVHPDHVIGTLQRGYDLTRALARPFQRAVALMFILSEVHPFDDGNGRVSRALMNAELVNANQSRIIIPTVYRDEYLSGLRNMSRQHDPEALISTLDFAQRFVASVDWTDYDRAERQLRSVKAFEFASADAKLSLHGTTR